MSPVTLALVAVVLVQKVAFVGVLVWWVRAA